MRIGSIIDISLVDVPGIPVSVIFTGGCNFNCPYCQNADLISLDSGTEVSISEIIERVSGHFVDGYCITGGEPTLQKELPELLKDLRNSSDGHINLNTQGSVPDVLRQCVPYLDSVWFDIKTSPSKYLTISRTKDNPWKRVENSIKYLLKSSVSFWPRTTYVGKLMTPNDILSIADKLASLGYSGKYTVQNYIASSGVRENEKEFLSSPDRSEIDEIADLIPPQLSLNLEWR
ncbi:MAG: anaerobic ribonucleoside-triphosphate reductase activating protein [Candidatus Lokiarchaeota archaeon]|nr:anaerobic ribonucleoside-triphosphate reductase activating protein [Candidatus Lokiarchaeota archaeon]